jgi:hypothetical protein
MTRAPRVADAAKAGSLTSPATDWMARHQLAKPGAVDDAHGFAMAGKRFCDGQPDGTGTEHHMLDGVRHAICPQVGVKCASRRPLSSLNAGAPAELEHRPRVAAGEQDREERDHAEHHEGDPEERSMITCGMTSNHFRTHSQRLRGSSSCPTGRSGEAVGVACSFMARTSSQRAIVRRAAPW